MKAKANDQEDLIRRYLLGEAAGQEKREIEQRTMIDEPFLNQVLMVEENLIDEYVRGELDPHDRARFQRHFRGAPQRHEDVAFAADFSRCTSALAAGQGRALADGRQSLEEQIAPVVQIPRRVLSIALAGAALVLVIAAGLSIEVARLRREMTTAHAAQTALESERDELRKQLDQQLARRGELELEIERQREKLAASDRELIKMRYAGRLGTRTNVTSLVLVAGLSRTEHRVAVARLFRNTQSLRFTLNVGRASYVEYQAELQTAEGDAVWSEKIVISTRGRSGNRVSFVVPAERITRSDYVVRLTGRTPDGASERVGTYHFRAERR